MKFATKIRTKFAFIIMFFAVYADSLNLRNRKYKQEMISGSGIDYIMDNNGKTMIQISKAIGQSMGIGNQNHIIDDSVGGSGELNGSVVNNRSDEIKVDDESVSQEKHSNKEVNNKSNINELKQEKKYDVFELKTKDGVNSTLGNSSVVNVLSSANETLIKENQNEQINNFTDKNNELTINISKIITNNNRSNDNETQKQSDNNEHSSIITSLNDTHTLLLQVNDNEIKSNTSKNNNTIISTPQFKINNISLNNSIHNNKELVQVNNKLSSLSDVLNQNISSLNSINNTNASNISEIYINKTIDNNTSELVQSQNKDQTNIPSVYSDNNNLTSKNISENTSSTVDKVTNASISQNNLIHNISIKEDKNNNTNIFNSNSILIHHENTTQPEVLPLNKTIIKPNTLEITNHSLNDTVFNNSTKTNPIKNSTLTNKTNEVIMQNKPNITQHNDINNSTSNTSTIPYTNNYIDEFIINQTQITTNNSQSNKTPLQPTNSTKSNNIVSNITDTNKTHSSPQEAPITNTTSSNNTQEIIYEDVEIVKELSPQGKAALQNPILNE